MTADKKTDDAGNQIGNEENLEETGQLGELPKVDFSTFVLSLGTTALYQLGVMSNPASGELADPDPLIAQQTIDTLQMLRDKTRGNLDDEERKLIDSLLYELRMRFVKVGR
jgi:hypothetical protein